MAIEGAGMTRDHPLRQLPQIGDESRRDGPPLASGTHANNQSAYSAGSSTSTIVPLKDQVGPRGTGLHPL